MHVVTEALTGHYVNVQIQKAWRKALEFGVHHVAKPLGIALRPVVLLYSTHVCYHQLQHASLALDDSTIAVNYGVKAGAKATGKAMAKIAFRTGFYAATSVSTVGLVAGVAVGANLLFEGPILAHSIYQLNRKKTFKKISEREYKVEAAKQGLISGSAAVGGIAGAIAGQIVIPVPGLGAAVGGVIGSVCGQMAGRAEGALVSKLASEKDINTLPEIVQKSFVFICDSEKI